MNTTTLSSKGQVVIPQEIRERLRLKEGTVFAVQEWNGLLVLKLLDMPSKEELIAHLHRVAEEGEKVMAQKGIREEDVPEIIHHFRARRYKERRQAQKDARRP